MSQEPPPPPGAKPTDVKPNWWDTREWSNRKKITVGGVAVFIFGMIVGSCGSSDDNRQASSESRQIDRLEEQIEELEEELEDSPESDEELEQEVEELESALEEEEARAERLERRLERAFEQEEEVEEETEEIEEEPENEEEEEEETEEESSYQIEAQIGATAAGISIAPEQDLTECRIDVNSGVIRSGYTFDIPYELSEGEAYTINYGQLTNNGERFNYAEQRPEMVSLNCEEGFNSWGW